MNTTTPCEVLRDCHLSLLAGELQEAQHSQLTDHLNSCTACQRWLELQQASPKAWGQAAQWLRMSGKSPTDAPNPARTRNREVSNTEPDTADNPANVTARFYDLLGPSDDPESAGRIGNLEIVGVLGRGGAGIVFKAIDRALGRKVALKILDPSRQHQSAARHRFAREARAMAAISHEHVVPVFAVAEHRGLPYFEMEYVTGGTLAARLAEDGPIGLRETVRVGLQVARGLAAAHRQGVIHRDVKPNNILLDPGVERVRVADFGLARAAGDPTETIDGTLVGTPHYMSPERVRCDILDPRSDLFSLGSVLYIASTGQLPFQADTVYALMQKIANDPATPPSHHRPELPAWFDSLVLKLLAKNPTARFASADELATVLENELAYLQQEPTGTAPSRDWIQPVNRRRSGRFVWKVIGLLGLVGSIMAGLWLRPPSTWFRQSPNELPSGAPTQLDALDNDLQ